MFSSVSLDSALDKICQLPSADRSSSSTILKACLETPGCSWDPSRVWRSNFFHNDIEMVFAFLFFRVILLSHFAVMVPKCWQWELLESWHRSKQWPSSVLVAMYSSPLGTHSEKNTSSHEGPGWSIKHYEFCSILSLECPHFEYFRWQSKRDISSTEVWKCSVCCEGEHCEIVWVASWTSQFFSVEHHVYLKEPLKYKLWLLKLGYLAELFRKENKANLLFQGGEQDSIF